MVSDSSCCKKGEKNAKGIVPESTQKVMYRPFAAHSASSWNITIELYVQSEREDWCSQMNEFSSESP
jgi:hypothetical protein